MRLGAIHPAAGATRAKKRRGKGAASGVGGTAGRGHKGKKARAGGSIPVWFEGGQMPIQRRTPKRGFVNPSRVDYQVVAIARLSGTAAGTVIDRGWLQKAGMVRGSKPVKLLGGGTVQAALTVRVDAASQSARKAIEAAGGTIETKAKA
jgi:large subunit ribosomal protein L15